MGKEREILPGDVRRAAALSEEVRRQTDALHRGPSLLPTPEEARKRALLSKVDEEQGY